MKLQKGQEILFKAIDEHTGQEIERRGIVQDDAFIYINSRRYLQAEYGNVLPGEAYIVQETPPSKAFHLVTLMDLLKVY